MNNLRLNIACPRLDSFVAAVQRDYPIISRKLQGYVDELSLRGETYFSDAEAILKLASEIAQRKNWSDDQLCEFYAEFVISYLREQSSFQQCGEYSSAKKTFAEIQEDVYSDDEYMSQYMMGLLLSYALFPHHYSQYEFYKSHFLPSIKDGGRCSEFGVGHGLFLATLLSAKPGYRGLGYEVSPAALDLAQVTLSIFGVSRERYTVCLEDVVKADLPDDQYDALTAAGLLEHIENPAEFLRRTSAHLTPVTGRMFVMLPINTAHTDHLILFDNAMDCRKLMQDNGFKLVEERLVPTEDLPPEQLETKKVPIVYLGIYRT